MGDLIGADNLVFSGSIILLLMLISSVFSAGETAFTAASPARMIAAEKEGNKRATLVQKILERKDRMIGAFLLGNNVINILASAITTSLLIEIFGEAGVIYATAVMTVLILVFAEVLPKTYAFHKADKLALFMAPFAYIVITVLSPITELIAKIVNRTLHLFGADLSKGGGADENIDLLRGAIEMHRGGQNEETDKQRRMLRSILDLADVTVEEVMIHRKNVSMVDLNLNDEVIIDQILQSPFTRIPLWRDDPDNIVGLIHAKWILRELKNAEKTHGKIRIEDIAAEPWFIPNATTLFDQLQAFRDRGEHFAFVVDEYGSFMGVVTLEDILEEIVGDIDDEHDVTVQGVRKLPNGSALVNGTVTIRDLNREFEWELPDEDYSTIAGLILYEAERLPEVGQVFSFFGFEFEIVRRHRHQITLIRVTAPQKH
jgi:Mg2+/Co2+ transporter CorB